MTPAGATPTTLHAARRMLAEQGLVHVVGCYTSSSPQGGAAAFREARRAALVSLALRGLREQRQRRLHRCRAQPAHRAAGRAPAAPLRHQRLLPRLELHLGLGEQQDHARGGAVGRRHRVWPSATSRSARLDFDGIIRQILDCRPSFIFNTLIGDSAYAFFRAIRRAANAHGIDQRRTMPVASCSLAEPELVEIGAEAAAGTSELERLFRKHRHAGQPSLRPGLSAANSRRRARPRPMPRPPTSRSNCWPAPSAARAPPRWPPCGRPCPTWPSKRRRARCASIATTATAYLTPRIGVSTDRFGVRRDLRGAGAREARPLSRLAGRAGGVATAAPAAAFAWSAAR